MKQLICPNCHKAALIALADGYYKCESCGYLGLSNFKQDLFKK